MKAIVVASIIANHDLAKEFNSKLIVLSERRVAIVLELIDSAKAEYEKLTFEFEYKVITAKHEPFIGEDMRACEPIRIVRTWVNKDAWLAVSLRNGVKPPPIPAKTISCIYGNINGVLVKGDNSGIDFMQSNVPITDDQWVALLSGEVDDLLKRNKAA